MRAVNLLPELTPKLDPFFIVSYAYDVDCMESCSWCDRPAVIRIDGTPKHLINFGCEDCAAKHMQGNAHVLSDDVPPPDNFPAELSDG